MFLISYLTDPKINNYKIFIMIIHSNIQLKNTVKKYNYYHINKFNI